MAKTKKYSKSILILTFLILSSLLFSNPVNADSYQIDSVIMKLDDTSLVDLPIDDYVNIYITAEGALFNFLKGEDGLMEVVGVRSGDKYINIDEYVSKYITYSPNLSKALEQSESMSYDLVSKIRNISTYKISVTNVKIGQVEGLCLDNEILVKIPKEIADNQIGYIEMNFSKDVKIVEIDNQVPSIDLIERFKNNGYYLTNYYNNYRVATSWSFRKLYFLQSSTTYTVETRDGYKDTFSITLSIE